MFLIGINLFKNIKNINPPEAWDPWSGASGIKNIKNRNPPEALGD